jgi:hypothetical protein
MSGTRVGWVAELGAGYLLAEIRVRVQRFPGWLLDFGEMEKGRYDDLADRVEESARAFILAKMPPDESGELARKPLRELQVIYGNWRGRLPTPRRRRVHLSRELNGSDRARQYGTELAELVQKIEAGEDISHT